MSKPAEVNVCVVEDDRWGWTFTWSDSEGNTDLTGLTTEIRIATSYDAVSASETLTDGSGLTVTASTGVIQVDWAIDLDPGDYVWSLTIGDRTRIRGRFKVLKKVPA